MFYLMCPATRTFGSSKLLICLFSHAVPDGGFSASADTQAKNWSPSCILPMSVFLSKVNMTPILLPLCTFWVAHGPFVGSSSIILD